MMHLITRKIRSHSGYEASFRWQNLPTISSQALSPRWQDYKQISLILAPTTYEILWQTNKHLFNYTRTGTHVSCNLVLLITTVGSSIPSSGAYLLVISDWSELSY